MTAIDSDNGATESVDELAYTDDDMFPGLVVDHVAIFNAEKLQ